MNTQKQIFLIVVLSFVFVGGCAAYTAYDLPARFELQDEYQYNGRVERGALLFANNCRTCHGIKGQGFVGPALNGAARVEGGLADFQDQSPLILAANQALIRRTLQCGRAGTIMPAWLKDNGGSLSRIQVEHLVELMTAPTTELDEEGKASSKGWIEALEFGHNLNHEASALIGGDTLGNIAKGHNIGPAQLLELNKATLKFQDGQEATINGNLKRGSKIKLVPNDSEPKGREYQIRQDNETLAKIAESQSVGAMLIADLNGIPYKMNYKTAQLQLFDVKETTSPRPGLKPGSKLKLPDNASYTVISGDTIQAITDHHGLTATQLSDLNKTILANLKADAVIDHEPRLVLPNGTGVVAQKDDTLATIASTHGIKPDEFATLNGLAIDSIVVAGTRFKLPDATKYVIQTGDTLTKVAANHGISVADLQKSAAVTSDANTKLATTVTLALPKIEALKVNGQNLTDLAKTFGGVTAADFATENKVDVNAILFVGQTLTLPPGTYGSAPPDAKNSGSACVQYAVSKIVYDGFTTPPLDPAAGPETVSTTVTVEAHSNDWTITADGTAQAANKGVVTVATGTKITFKSVVGLHNIIRNGTKQGDDLPQGSTRELTFPDAGKFKIACNYHPDMLAFIFVK